jgi:hypothetical protein
MLATLQALREEAAICLVHGDAYLYAPPSLVLEAFAEIDRLKELVESLATRAAGQSELLTAKAEKSSAHISNA